MARKPSHDELSNDGDHLAFSIEKKPDGIYVDTSNDNVWTFRRDLDAYEDGEDVWIPDLDGTPQAIIAALEFEGYTIRDEE